MAVFSMWQVRFGVTQEQGVIRNGIVRSDVVHGYNASLPASPGSMMRKHCTGIFADGSRPPGKMDAFAGFCTRGTSTALSHIGYVSLNACSW